jgi:hypothetical protein
MKRMTETRKWQDSWFMDLPAKYKLAWFWILDNCDHAGLIDPNSKLMSFMVGEPIDGEEFLRMMAGRVTKPKSGKWFVTSFISFQYGTELNPRNSAHRGVLRILNDQQIECPVSVFNEKDQGPNKPLGSPSGGAQDKDKDKDKDKEIQIRAGTLLRKRAETLWDHAEIRAYAKNKSVIAATPEADWLVLEKFYAAPQAETFKRKSLATLLNNWNGEIDRAKNWEIEATNKSKPIFTRESTIDRS